MPLGHRAPIEGTGKYHILLYLFSHKLHVYRVLIFVSAAHSKIALGIAGPDISADTHPGNRLDTVGYHSDTGQCYTSHQHIANTEGEKFGVGKKSVSLL